MNLKTLTAELNLEELNECAYALSRDLRSTIDSHWQHLQQSDNAKKRSSFYAYEDKRLKLLQSIGSVIDRKHIYADVVAHLDKVIPMEKNDE